MKAASGSLKGFFLTAEAPRGVEAETNKPISPPASPFPPRHPQVKRRTLPPKYENTRRSTKISENLVRLFNTNSNSIQYKFRAWLTADLCCFWSAFWLIKVVFCPKHPAIRSCDRKFYGNPIQKVLYQVTVLQKESAI